MAGGQRDFSRDTALDGLRGWAALSVVVYHCLWQTFGRLFPELHGFIPALVGNGILAVGTFLAISGYVLTRGRWRRDVNPSLIVAFARRYVRLTIPIIAASLIVFVLMSLAWTPTRAAFDITQVPRWYGSFADFQPDILGVFSFSTAGTYGRAGTQNYGPFLWTMVIELWGSLVVFAISQSGRYWREPYTVLLLCMALAIVILPLAACFFAGALIALMERDGVIFRAPPKAGESTVATLLVIGILVVGAIVQIIDRDQLSLSVLAVGLFLAAKRSLPTRRFLELPVSRALGALSFPLYLSQYAIIISLSAWMLIWFDAAGALNAWTALLIAALSVLASLALAVVLLPVEHFTLAMLRQFDGYRARRTARLVAGAAA